MSRWNVFFAKIKNVVRPMLLFPSQLRISYTKERDYTDLYLATCATMSVVVPSAAAYKVAEIEENKLNETRLMNRFKLGNAYCTPAYDRHIICMGNEGDRTANSLSSSLLKRDDELLNNRVSIVKEGGGGVGRVLCDGDILVVPDMIIYRGLHESNMESFLDYVVGNGAPSTNAIQLEIREKEAPAKEAPAKEANEPKQANEAKETSAGST